MLLQVVDRPNGDHIAPPQLKCATTKGEVRDEQTLRKVEPNKPLELITLDLSHLETMARIGRRMTSGMRHAIQQLLTEHRDVFSWSHEDMLENDPNVIQHQLSMDSKVKGVKQKFWNFSVEKNAAILQTLLPQLFLSSLPTTT